MNIMIKNEKQYNAACERIEELLKVVGNDTPTDDNNLILPCTYTEIVSMINFKIKQ